MTSKTFYIGQAPKEFSLSFCKICDQMTNWKDGVCQKCQVRLPRNLMPVMKVEKPFYCKYSSDGSCNVYDNPEQECDTFQKNKQMIDTHADAKGLRKVGKKELLLEKVSFGLLSGSNPDTPYTSQDLREAFDNWFDEYFGNTQGEDSPYRYEDIVKAFEAGTKEISLLKKEIERLKKDKVIK